jgi:hypothetical protein
MCALACLVTALVASVAQAQTPQAPSTQAQATANSQVRQAAGVEPVAIRAVLELFTSQGCSSCPAADKVLERHSKQPGVLALSFAVDYWDYLGWKDTLAHTKFTQRQKYYARMRGDGQVYTPQAIVNGVAHTNGADQSSIDRAVRETEKARAAGWVPVGIARDGKHLVITASAAPDGRSAADKDATLWLVTYNSRVDVAVKRGENAGKALSYANVVRDITAIGMWTGVALTLTIDRDAIAQAGEDGCAILLQAGKTGPIIGAAVIPLL